MEEESCAARKRTTDKDKIVRTTIVEGENNVII
jgi:hypothetical protein